MTPPKHNSMRGWFAAALHDVMAHDERVWLLTGDLGYGMLDDIRDDFPRRFINVGASEQALVGAGVGLALSGMIPFCYSITPFLIFRPFEWHRNYLHHEMIPVKLVGSGLDDDYKKDGFTHHAHDVTQALGLVPNIRALYPTKMEQMPEMVNQMCSDPRPYFIALRR